MNSEEKPDDAVPEKSDSTKAEPTPDLKPADPSQTNQSAFKAIIGGTCVLAVILIVVGVLFATGVVGGSDDSGELSDGQVALVSDVPDGLGEISQEDFDNSFDRIWKSGGLPEAPAEGDPQYEQVKEAAVSDLLDQAWLKGEAAEQGVSVTEEEVDEEFVTIREQEFKTDKAYEQYLEESGLSDEQVMEQVELQVLSGKIQDEVSGDGNAAAQQEAMSTFVTEYETRWKARTTCAEGYITERCGNAPEPEMAEATAGDESAGADEVAEEVPTGEIDDLDAKPPVEASSDPAPEALETEDIVEGDGATAAKGDQVSVQYLGALYDTGEEFDSSWSRNGEPFEFELGSGSVIKGWDQGLVGMKEGGRRKLTIPADLAYGSAGSPPTIPPDATLVFIVDLESVN